MPRTSRKISDSGIYHIIVRGINKQDIFYDKQDYMKFLSEVKSTKEKYNYEIYAYCLMPNHVHMEIMDKDLSLEFIMRTLMVAYASYFNKKYERTGHVFQDRYLSKEVETKEYVLDLQRYIHQNPEKAGICGKEEYQWSSYKEYMCCKSNIVDTYYIMQLFGMNLQEFKRYNDNDVYMTKKIYEFEMTRKITDEKARFIIQEELKIDNLQEIQQYSSKVKQDIFKKLIKIKDVICISQIARIVGINRKTIERMLKNEEKMEKRP